MRRNVGVLVVLFTVCFSWLDAPRARADATDLEIGGFVGGHLFSEDNELGVLDFAGADSMRNSIALGVRLAYPFHRLVSLEGELTFMPTETRVTDRSTLVFGWRAHALVHFVPPDTRLRPFATAGGGALSAPESDGGVTVGDTDAQLHGGVGVKYRIHGRWTVRSDARLLLPPSSDDRSFTTDFELFLGVSGSFGKKKAKAVEKILVVDTDGDGIPDDADRCIEEKEDPDGHEDDDGCPDADNDGDQIADADDQCPNDPEPMNGIDDEDGCPEKDDDNDGVLGSADECPTNAEDGDGFEDEDGCPDEDNDGDGIPDADDKCRDEPETVNSHEDLDGCPDTVPAPIAR